MGWCSIINQLLLVAPLVLGYNPSDLFSLLEGATMLVRFLLIGLVGLLAFVDNDSLAMAHEPQLTLVEARESDDVKIQLRIAGENRIPQGETFAIELVITPKKSGKMLYQPRFNRLLPPCGSLALFDSEKRYLGDIFLRTGGSFIYPGPQDWVPLTDQPIVVRGEYCSDRLGELEALPPGQYYVQLTFHAGVIADRRDDLKNDLLRHAAWDNFRNKGRQHLTGPCTSDVEFTITRQ